MFDGHGGRAAVDFVSERLARNVVSAVLAAGTETQGEPWSSSAAEEDAVSAAIRAAYLATDNELLSRNTRCVQRTARVTLRTKTHVRFVYRVYYAYMHFRPTLNTSKRFLFVLAMYISSSFWMTMPPCDYLRTLAVSLALFIRKEIKKKER